MSERQSKKKKSGPDPERLALSGDWRDRMGRALKKKRPKEGWPESEGTKGEAKKKGG